MYNFTQYKLLHMDMPVLANQERLTYFCADTRWSQEDWTGTMDYKDEFWERVRELYAISVTSWLWYVYNTLYILESM